MSTALLLLAAGLVLLTAGAEALVRGSARLARAVGISPVVVGLTVVAFGTSSPELAVCTVAAVHGRAAIAIGNVVGSNIFNVLVILGLCATIRPLATARQLIRIDVPVMIGASLLAFVLAGDGRVGRLDGMALVALLVLYVARSILAGRRRPDGTQLAASAAGRPEQDTRATVRNSLLTFAGLAVLVLGSELLVKGAVGIARGLGMSEVVIGLTIVAVGTSLPEVATSVLATWRGERDIAVGNAIGSSIFNLLGVLGVAALLSPKGVTVAPAMLRIDLPVMLAAAVACLPVFFTDARIDRWEGLSFLVLYAGYTTWLVLDATGRQAASTVSRAMLWVVVPLVTLALVTTSLHAVRQRHRRRPS